MGRDAGPSDDHRRHVQRDDVAPRLTFVQRQALKELAKQARKRPDEPLSPADWVSPRRPNG